MLYSVSVRQPDSVRANADEFMVDYNDINTLYDVIEKYPDKKYVVRLPRGYDIDWPELKMFYNKVNLTLAIEDLHMANECKVYGMNFYWAYPITSYYELQGVVDLGVSQVLIGAPLYFDLKEVAKRDKKIRLVANLCFDGYIPRVNGACGTYIRPEDIKVYDEFVETVEFFAETLTKEATLLEIYQRGEWGGNLNIVLTNLGIDVDNRAIPEEFGVARVQCRQNCMRSGNCHMCENSMIFS